MSDIIQTICNLEVKGSKFGLGRTRDLLRHFGYPEKKLKIIHIAGSNGKGSIAEYMTRILLEDGKSVGTFTSPAVFDYAEKFKVNGNLPNADRLRARLSEVYEVASRMDDKPTAFEMEVVAALNLFVGEGLEYAVVECGLGGREDATNAISCKSMAIISSVSLEHTAVLGNTIGEICAHKAGIIKDCPCVVNALQSAEGRAYFASLGVTFADGVENIRKIKDGGQSFELGGTSYTIRMSGSAQCYNAATVVVAARLLGCSEGAISRGLASAYLAGRVQSFEVGGRTYILDGSHNPASFAPLTELLAGLKGDKTLIFSCLSDKDVDAAADILSLYFGRVLLVPSQSYRRMARERMFKAFEGKIEDVACADSIEHALALSTDNITVLCGSFTVLKEGRQWIERGQ